jgi:eukaryotic-like serine/threonine-protein kinase
VRQMISLPGGQWEYDDSKPLGRAGGFGVVYAGKGKDSNSVAIKRLHVHAAAAGHRELRVAQDLAGRQLVNVIPVFDSGQDAQSDAYFVVMARAERSLQDELNLRKNLGEQETAHVLLDIASGLQEVSHLTHRDLKPANVLYHEGKWKIADFGIACFVEETTSLRTLNECLTPEYAAPEQWLVERATTATDIYALGCIAHALLAGSPPFQGTQATLKNRHLNEAPPILTLQDHRLSSLTTMMLRKLPETRPTLDRVRAVLDAISKTIPDKAKPLGLAALERAGAHAAREEAEEESRQIEEEKARQVRANLESHGQDVLEKVLESLMKSIQDRAPTSRKIESERGLPSSVHRDELFQICLGMAQITVLTPVPFTPSDFPHSHWDVILGTTIGITNGSYKDEGCTMLWYMRLQPQEAYRWYEVSYKPCLGKYTFTIPESPDLAAAQGVVAPHAIAYGPKTIDDENVEDFCDRWAGRLAAAYLERRQN